TRCFQTFPFPNSSDEQKVVIRGIGKQLDDHRKQRQAQYPTLTITEMYNVLEKLRSKEELTPKDQQILEQGLVIILKKLHDELDAAVAAAYGWTADLKEQEILERLAALNKERAAEEARGIIRWLRPEYQNPQGVQQTGMDVKPDVDIIKASKQEALEWPKTLAEQAQAVQRAIQIQERPITAEELCQYFKPATKAHKTKQIQQVESLLQTLNGLGLLRVTDKGEYIK
ncbi:MAG TPA: hypothetical protein VD794_09140, partial [Flavisolibacter sp.]|nr:hypothetical protein [Flavisolibacter sp.]